MFAVVVELTLKQDTVAEAMPLIEANAQTSLASEDGCHQFDVLLDANRPAEVLLYELYTSAQAFEQHLQTSHFKSFDAASAGYIEHKTVRTYRQVLQ